MFFSKGKNEKQEMENLFHEIQINLENNYKDLAISARKKAEKRLQELQNEGSLKEKDFKKLSDRLDEYTRRMEGYHH